MRVRIYFVGGSHIELNITNTVYLFIKDNLSKDVRIFNEDNNSIINLKYAYFVEVIRK